MLSGATFAPNFNRIDTLRTDVDAVQTSYRTERAEQQRAARLLALRQRFQLEVDSNQLERAGQTLAEILQTNEKDYAYYRYWSLPDTLIIVGYCSDLSVGNGRLDRISILAGWVTN